MTAPVAIAARLNYTRDQATELSRPKQTTAEVRPLLRRFHDELLATLAPRLAAMRAEGILIDHATSWLLGEFVAHVAADHVEAAQKSLSACPELKNVAPAAPLQKGRRQRH